MVTVVSSDGAVAAGASVAGALVGSGVAAGAQAESKIPAMATSANKIDRVFFISNFSLWNLFFRISPEKQWLK